MLTVAHMKVIIKMTSHTERVNTFGTEEIIMMVIGRTVSSTAKESKCLHVKILKITKSLKK